jgi:transposase-like protein/IS1 family transposase
MNCPSCEGATRRFGKNRNGSQRFRCDACEKTFTDESTRPVDRRKLNAEKAVLCLRMLLEGNSIRSTERLTEVHRDTIIDAMIEAGEKCEAFLTRVVQDVHANDVQADEIWGFVGCKEKTRQLKGYSECVGDAWCYVAIERDTKLILAWHLDKRTPLVTTMFSAKLRTATSGRFQLSTDGMTQYRTAVPLVFGYDNIDYAQLVKTYGNTPEQGTAARYSPGDVVGIQTVVLMGQPDDARICTSHAERSNLSIRMAVRRMTRLTNAHSKKWDNHKAAMALYFAYYNFCRVHTTLTDATRTEDQPKRKTTPAMASGLTDHVWSVAELLARIAA